MLRDLSLTIPSSIYLTTMTITQPVDTPDSVVGAWGNSGLASITLHGQAAKLTDVAAWLDSLTKAKYYGDPYVTTAVRPDVKKDTAFQFDSTVLITPVALTDRYAAKAGS